MPSVSDQGSKNQSARRRCPCPELRSSREQEIESAALVLLWRYGIVFRDLVQRETTMPRWRELLGMLRRLEARGSRGLLRLGFRASSSRSPRPSSPYASAVSSRTLPPQ